MNKSIFEQLFFKDRYAVGFFKPGIDKYQDWKLHFGREIGDYSVYKFSRQLRTCNFDEDRTINVGTTILIWAYSPRKPKSVEDDIFYHGRSNRGYRTVVLWEKNLPEPGDELLNNTLPLNFIVENFLVSRNIQKNYLCNFFDLPDFGEKYHIIAAETVLNTTSSIQSTMQRMQVYLCQPEPEIVGLLFGNKNYICHNPNVLRAKDHCKIIVYAWSIGGERVYLPRKGGIPIGNKRLVVLTEILFKKDEFERDVIENSGVRLFITKDLRPYDYTILRLGVEVSPLMIIPPGERDFKTIGHCSKMCLTETFDLANVTEITLTSYFAQLNSKGIDMKARIFRGNEELEPIIIENSYDFKYRTFVRLPKERKLRRGDRLAIECRYKTIGEKKETIGGRLIENEMCLAFFTVYPAIPLTNCKSSPRSVEIIQLYDNKTTTSVDWSKPAKRKMAQEIALSDHVVNFCSGPKKSKFKSNGQSYFVPTPKSVYSQTDKCDSFPIPTENYPNSMILKYPNFYKFYWKIKQNEIVFEIQVRTKSWAGFGISINGNMIGSDVIMAWEDNNGIFHFDDRHIVDYNVPLIDDKQDWMLISGKRYGEYIIAKFYRKLDTCDKDDIVISEGTNRIIWSFMDGAIVDDGIIRYHGSDRGTASVQLLQRHISDKQYDDSNNINGAFLTDYRMSNFTVPPDSRTHYQCQLYKVPKLGKKHHVVGLDALLNNIDSSVIHHMILRACSNDIEVEDQDIGVNFECFGPLNEKYPNCNPIIFVWNVGGERQYFTQDAAYPFGRDTDAKYVKLEVHYNNLGFKKNIVDNSGLRLWMTDKLLREDIQILEIGHVFSTEHIIPPKQPSFKTVSHCPSQCLLEAMDSINIEKIKVISVLVHGHFLVRAIKVRHFRDGIELEPILIEKHYDFNFQNFVLLKKPREILRGDRVTVECSYDSTKRNKVTLGGIESIDEMCLAYLTSYPSIPLSNCKTKPQNQKIKALYGNDIDSVIWTVDMVKAQENLAKDLDVEISCSFGTLEYSSDKTETTLFPILQEYEPKNRLCPK